MMALVKTYCNGTQYRAYICTWLCMSDGVGRFVTITREQRRILLFDNAGYLKLMHLPASRG